MNNKIFRDLLKNFADIGRKFQSTRNDRINLIVFSFIFIIVGALVFSYNNNIKKKRLEAIDSFLSNDQTVLLKNYLLNQIKSPYLEYDYVVQNNDTVESILKKFSVKQNEINFIVAKIKKMKLSNITPNYGHRFNKCTKRN